MRKDRNPTLVFAVSFGVHALVLVGLTAVATVRRHASMDEVSLEIVATNDEARAIDRPPDARERVDPERPRERPRSRDVASTPPPAAPTSGADAPDLGVALEGVAGGSGSFALPIGDPSGVRGGGGGTTHAHRSLGDSDPPQEAERARCTDDAVPPRQRSVPRVAYTDEAIAARVEGLVRVRISLDDHGRVTDARIVSSLGHGLDESALASVREASFEPSTRCGRAIPTSFVLGIRFRL